MLLKVGKNPFAYRIWNLPDETSLSHEKVQSGICPPHTSAYFFVKIASIRANYLTKKILDGLELFHKRNPMGKKKRQVSKLKRVSKFPFPFYALLSGHFFYWIVNKSSIILLKSSFSTHLKLDFCLMEPSQSSLTLFWGRTVPPSEGLIHPYSRRRRTSLIPLFVRRTIHPISLGGLLYPYSWAEGLFNLLLCQYAYSFLWSEGLVYIHINLWIKEVPRFKEWSRLIYLDYYFWDQSYFIDPFTLCTWIWFHSDCSNLRYYVNFNLLG